MPYVLGYPPHESVVVVFVTGDGRLTCALCVGPQAPDTFIIAESSTAASGPDANRALVVGYGPQSDRATCSPESPTRCRMPGGR